MGIRTKKRGEKMIGKKGALVRLRKALWRHGLNANFVAVVPRLDPRPRKEKGPLKKRALTGDEPVTKLRLRKRLY